MAWLFLWHYEYFVLSVVVMLVLLIVLIKIYLRLRIDRVSVPPVERCCVDLPFSIYLGWITVATIANITSVLYYLQWDGWGINPEVWALIMLFAGVCITSAVTLLRGDLAYILVIIWAFAGIAVKHADVPLISTGAWIATALVGILLIVGIAVNRQHHKNLSPA